MAMAARIPIMITTTKSSTSVKPFSSSYAAFSLHARRYSMVFSFPFPCCLLYLLSYSRTSFESQFSLAVLPKESFFGGSASYFGSLSAAEVPCIMANYRASERGGRLLE